MTMKILKFRLRSFALLTVVLTLTLFLLNLSPSAVSQHFFRLSATDNLPTSSTGNHSRAEKRIYSNPFKEYESRIGLGSTEGEKNVVNASQQEAREGGGASEGKQKDSKNVDNAKDQHETRINSTDDNKEHGRENTKQKQSQSDSEAPKTNRLKSDETGGSYVRQDIANGEEHDSYVQDYPDYTPAEFVEVLKTKLSDKVKKPARISGKKQGIRRPPDEKFSREALRARALEFSTNSVRKRTSELVF